MQTGKSALFLTLHTGGIYTTMLLYEYGGLVFSSTEEMQRLYEVILSVEVNCVHGMWACRFWQALEVQHDVV